MFSTYRKIKYFIVNNSVFKQGTAQIILLGEQIYENFEENKYALGVFIDLEKAFDTAGHKIPKRYERRPFTFHTFFQTKYNIASNVV